MPNQPEAWVTVLRRRCLTEWSNLEPGLQKAKFRYDATQRHEAARQRPKEVEGKRTRPSATTGLHEALTATAKAALALETALDDVTNEHDTTSVLTTAEPVGSAGSPPVTNGRVLEVTEVADQCEDPIPKRDERTEVRVGQGGVVGFLFRAFWCPDGNVEHFDFKAPDKFRLGAGELLAEVEPLQAMTARTAQWTDAALRRALRAQLDDWRGFVDGRVEQARKVLDAAFSDRLTFTKTQDAEGRDLWTLEAPLAWDRVLERLAPNAFGGLQVCVASPAGFEPAFQP